MNRKGYTLVEIMIVVVVIGLLAAMAIPIFQSAREGSIGGSMDNDARQIMGAANQYFLQNPGELAVTINVNTTSGAVLGSLSTYVSTISKGIFCDTVIAVDGTMQLSHPQYRGNTSITFDFQGHRVTP